METTQELAMLKAIEREKQREENIRNEGIVRHCINTDLEVQRLKNENIGVNALLMASLLVNLVLCIKNFL